MEFTALFNDCLKAIFLSIFFYQDGLMCGDSDLMLGINFRHEWWFFFFGNLAL